MRDERRFMRAIPDTPGPRDVLFARYTTRVGVERDKRYFLVIKREKSLRARARALPRRSGGDQKNISATHSFSCNAIYFSLYFFVPRFSPSTSFMLSRLERLNLCKFFNIFSQCVSR